MNRRAPFLVAVALCTAAATVTITGAPVIVTGALPSNKPVFARERESAETQAIKRTAIAPSVVSSQRAAAREAAKR